MNICRIQLCIFEEIFTTRSERKSSQTMFLLIGLLFLLFINISAIEKCDEKKCAGPLQYYYEIGCEPIKKPGECCPYKYNCAHRKRGKCYIHGIELNAGETLSAEHSGPCMHCTCEMAPNGVGTFLCSTPSCGYAPELSAGCYLHRSANICCPSEMICDYFPYGYSFSWFWKTKTSSEYDAICEIDGKTYGGGEFFIPQREPDRMCYCSARYAGENIMPYCYIQRGRCDIELHEAHSIINNCPPIYESYDSLHESCPSGFRCQEEGDTIIRNTIIDKSRLKDNADSKCRFGNLTLLVGEELLGGSSWNSKCMECICQVPPVLTCKRLPSRLCNYWGTSK